MLKITTAAYEDSVLTLDFVLRGNAVIEQKDVCSFPLKRTMDEDKDLIPKTVRWGETSDPTRADGNFGGQGCEQSTDLCLSECKNLLLALVFLTLALLFSMGLNIFFCIHQRGAFFPGTALKRWMFFKMQTVSVNLCISSTQINAARATEKSMLFNSPSQSCLNLIYLFIYFWKFF